MMGLYPTITVVEAAARISKIYTGVGEIFDSLNITRLNMNGGYDMDIPLSPDRCKVVANAFEMYGLVNIITSPMDGNRRSFVFTELGGMVAEDCENTLLLKKMFYNFGPFARMLKDVEITDAASFEDLVEVVITKYNRCTNNASFKTVARHATFMTRIFLKNVYIIGSENAVNVNKTERRTIHGYGVSLRMYGNTYTLNLRYIGKNNRVRALVRELKTLLQQEDK